MDQVFLLNIIDSLLQFVRVAIIISGVYFLVDQVFCYFHYKDESEDLRRVRRVFIGYDAVAIGIMGFAYFLRVFKFDTFAIMSSLIWLFLHLALFAVIVYGHQQVRIINRKI